MGDNVMDKSAKLRPFYIGKILFDLTDEEHCLSTPEIIKELKNRYGIDGYRTTIASDIDLLLDFGMDIEVIKSSSNLYHLISREFDLPELKLLIDAVESSKFITEKKSKELVAKLGKLTSHSQSEAIKRNLVPEGRIKPGNEHIYYIVDSINDAINSKRKISFQYFHYNEKKKQKPKHNGEKYIFSPYHLVWNGDYYYMIGFSDKHREIGSFRVDRISKQPVILDDAAVPAPVGFDLNDYINTSFRMYSTERKAVELICDNAVMDAIIDKFGEDVKTCKYNQNSFKAEVNIAVSHVFFGWVFGFGGKVLISAPEDVKLEYAEMAKQAYEKCIK